LLPLHDAACRKLGERWLAKSSASSIWSIYSMPFMTASVVAEGRDNAIYHTACNT
jgi:hypothetical protein